MGTGTPDDYETGVFPKKTKKSQCYSTNFQDKLVTDWPCKIDWISYTRGCCAMCHFAEVVCATGGNDHFVVKSSLSPQNNAVPTAVLAT